MVTRQVRSNLCKPRCMPPAGRSFAAKVSNSVLARLGVQYRGTSPPQLVRTDSVEFYNFNMQARKDVTGSDAFRE